MRRYLALALTILSLSAAKAADVEDLSEKYPTTLEDAQTNKKNELQFRLPVDYLKDDDDQYIISPNIEYGITNDVEAQVSTDIIQGTDQRSGSGDTTVGATYHFPGQVPDIAIKAHLIFPTGIDSKGLDHRLGFLSSVQLCPSTKSHLDISWLRNNSAQAGERKDGFRTGLGFQHIYNDKVSTLIAFIREVELEQNIETNFVELGALHSLGEKLGAAAAIGIGIGDDSPDYKARLALQQEF